MRIYPETLVNLALCHDWTTATAIAKERGTTRSSINQGIKKMYGLGLLERKKVVVLGAGIRNWWYEYKITPAGTAVLYPPPSKAEERRKRGAANAEARRAKHDRTGWLKPVKIESANTTNPFEWRTYVQPVPMKAGKWEQEPRPQQAINARFTQYQ